MKGEYSRNVLSPVHICEVMIIVDPDTDLISASDSMKQTLT